MSASDPVHDQRGRYELQGELPRLSLPPLFSVFPQAGAVFVADPFNCERQVAQQVPAISHLGGARGGLLDGTGVGARPAAAEGELVHAEHAGGSVGHGRSMQMSEEPHPTCWNREFPAQPCPRLSTQLGRHGTKHEAQA